MKLITGGSALLASLAVCCGIAYGSPNPNLNPWLDTQHGVLNMAHQGGEFEAPSSTMYAFHTALKDRGADSLELDVNATADNRLAVMHDYYTSKITPLDAQVRNLDFAQLQELDAAYWYSPGTGQFDHSKPADQYPLRGVRTGAKPAPAGYTPDDFRIPSMEEVLAAFPDTPINIEIKSVPGVPSESVRVATLLAEILNRSENEHRTRYGNRGVIVASLDQNALAKFHELAPSFDLSASLTSMISFIGAGTPITPKPVALQVPMVLGELDVPKTLQELDVRKHRYAVHAWTNGAETENDESYAKLIGTGLQGIITSSPSVLDDYLCRSGQRRPDRSPRCDSQVMKYSLGMPAKKLRKLPKAGLPIRTTCDQVCSVGIDISVRPRVARKLGIKFRPVAVKDGFLNIAAGSKSPLPKAAGKSVFRSFVTPRVYRRISRQKKIALRLRVDTYDSALWRVGSRQQWVKIEKPRPKKNRR